MIQHSRAYKSLEVALPPRGTSAVAKRLRRGDGRSVLPPYLNDLKHDRRCPPENAVIEQLAKILNLPSGPLFYATRMPPDLRRDTTENEVEPAYRAFRRVLGESIENHCFNRGLVLPMQRTSIITWTHFNSKRQNQ